MSFLSPTPTVDLAEESAFHTQDQIVLILCGLIASGKSTFAQALELHYSQFRRCNQDELGDRRRVEQLVYQTLNQGLSVCIDRTNFNASQRSNWIEIAREFPGTKIWVIVFDTPYETCVQRLQTRTNHPTILNPAQGLSVLSRFASDFQYPTTREGFDRILYIKPSDHPSPEYTRSDIAATLRRVQDSPPPAQSARQNTHHYQSPRGNSWRRGRWDEGREYNNNQYQPRVPRGRGGNLAGSSVNGRYMQRPPYRGSDVGIHGSGRGILPYAPVSRQSPANRTRFTSQGRGTADQDQSLID